MLRLLTLVPIGRHVGGDGRIYAEHEVKEKNRKPIYFLEKRNPTTKKDTLLTNSRRHERNCVGISAANIGSAKLSWMS